MSIEKARVINIVRGSFHDGTGLRTVVYFKGCTLHCKWCHNPESIDCRKQIMHTKSKCIHCKRCMEVCTSGCHSIKNGMHIFNREACIQCMECCNACPAEALSAVGKDMSVDEVLKEIIKDKHYFDLTKGGVTLSGGECLIFPDFIAALLERCRQEGIHTAIESAVHVHRSALSQVLDLIDLLIIDIKHYCSSNHMQLTGSSNECILDNIRFASDVHENIWIRIPLVPGLTDSEDNLINIANIIDTLGKGVQKVELLRYNHLSQSKYENLDVKLELMGLVPQSDAEMEEKVAVFKKALKKNIEIAYV